MTAQFEKHPFLLPSPDVAAALKTDIDNGLTSAQVAQLQNAYPSNELDIQGSISWHSILAKQLFNAMILGKCASTCIIVPMRTLGLIVMYTQSLFSQPSSPLPLKTGSKAVYLPRLSCSMFPLGSSKNTRQRRKWTLFEP